MNSSESFHLPPLPLSPVTLEISGIGPVCSFKNRKRIFGNKLVTSPDVKERMRNLCNAIASALLSECQTRYGATTPECWKAFATASLPQDDNWMELEIGHVRTRLVPKGSEGALITIERIS